MGAAQSSNDKIGSLAHRAKASGKAAKQRAIARGENLANNPQVGRIDWVSAFTCI